MTLAFDFQYSRALVAALLVPVFGLAAAPLAVAEKRGKAPIVYSGASSTASSVQKSGQGAKPTTSSRVEFRYPDQPDRYYSTSGTRVAGTSAPVKYSSSSAAVDQLSARDYAVRSAPAATASAMTKPSDPNLTAGAFDARAAARTVTPVRTMEQSSLKPVQEVAPKAIFKVPGAETVAVSLPPMPMFDEIVTAVIYGEEYNGLETANGELYAAEGMTAAHPNLPLPSLLHVINESTGREIVVRVNDRGPFEDGAGLQLSARAARMIGLDGAGQGKVRLRYLGAAPAEAMKPAAVQPQPRMIQAVATPQPVAPLVRKVAYQPNSDQFFVQVGSFADRANAERLHADLSGGAPVEIVAADVNGATWYRVRVGPVAGRPNADSLQQGLAADGFSGARIVAAD